MALNDKLQQLEEIIKTYDEILVALSGGVDSAFLLAFARKALGKDKVKAVTLCGPHLAKDEASYAATLCAALDIEHTVMDMAHILPIIEHNPIDRCYLCKKEMFSQLKAMAEKRGAVLADGTNLDDMDDYRPGHKALSELGVASPLKDASLTKDDIRIALKTAVSDVPALENGMPIWEKPAFACLASRIPYGENITIDKLSAIYETELYLRSQGFNQVRVRHHGDIARIEVPQQDRHRFFDEAFMDSINDEVKKHGFKYATLDLGGYTMGGGYHAK